MNNDIRISTSFFDHPKSRKLLLRSGAEGVLAWLRLLAWAGRCRPSGRLSKDPEDILLAAEAPNQEWFKHCCELNLLDESEDGTWEIHGWLEHNPYAANAESRSKAASLNAHKRWVKEKGVCDWPECEIHQKMRIYAVASKTDATRIASASKNDAGARKIDAPSPPPPPSPPPSLLGDAANASAVASAKDQVESFRLTDELREYARKNYPLVTDLDRQTENWRDHFRGNGYKTGKNQIRDATATWRTWMRNAQKWAEEKQTKAAARSGRFDDYDM